MNMYAIVSLAGRGEPDTPHNSPERGPAWGTEDANGLRCATT